MPAAIKAEVTFVSRIVLSLEKAQCRACTTQCRDALNGTLRMIRRSENARARRGPCRPGRRRRLDRSRHARRRFAGRSTARGRCPRRSARRRVSAPGGIARTRARARRRECPAPCRRPTAPPARLFGDGDVDPASARACSATHCRADSRAAWRDSPHRPAPRRPPFPVQPRSIPLASASGARATIASLASATRSTRVKLRAQPFGFQPRHRQQLLDQSRRARHAELRGRSIAAARARRIGRALGLADLQRQRRERRAQLVRGIGREPPLRARALRRGARAAR